MSVHVLSEILKYLTVGYLSVPVSALLMEFYSNYFIKFHC
jgi:hypothetical protein